MREAFEIFHKLDDEKIEDYIYLPYMENIFRGVSEEEAFQRYLLSGSEAFHYAYLFTEEYMNLEAKFVFQYYRWYPRENQQDNAMLSIILHAPVHNAPGQDHFLFSTDQQELYLRQYAKYEILANLEIAEIEENEKTEDVIRLREIQDTGFRSLSMFTYQGEPEYKRIGYLISIEADQLVNDHVAMEHICEVLKNNVNPVYQSFLWLHAYYQEIMKRKKPVYNRRFTTYYEDDDDAIEEDE